ncbi:MAG: hypothetical protein HQL53_02575 [Magnetococcales bacterium]|nr:hypothetical protein [Magnetococcales bacterium]
MMKVSVIERDGARQRFLRKMRLWIAVMCALLTFQATAAFSKTLQDAVSEAIQSNPSILTVQENWPRIERQVARAFDMYLPEVSMSHVTLRQGDRVNWFWVDGLMEEMYDIVILAGENRNMALGFKCAQIREILAAKQDDSESRVR